MLQREEGFEPILDIQEMFKFIAEKSQNIISSYSADGIFTYISPSVKALLGYTPDEVIGRPATDFNHPDDNIKLRGFRDTVVIDQDTVRFTGRVRHKNGQYRWFETTVEYIREPSGNIIQTIGVGRDITDRKEAEETISFLAYHDALTDLPNRRLFTDHVREELVEHAGLHGLMLLDLDGFKFVNDTFGHDVGDLLLTEAAKRLKNAVGDRGFAARWGGDEFTIFLARLSQREELEGFIRRIEEVISEPFLIEGHSLSVRASIGSSLYPVDGESVESLIRKADSGMYRVKNREKKP